MVFKDEQRRGRVFKLLGDVFADAGLLAAALRADFFFVRNGMFDGKARQLDRRLAAAMALFLFGLDRLRFFNDFGLFGGALQGLDREQKQLSRIDLLRAPPVELFKQLLDSIE